MSPRTAPRADQHHSSTIDQIHWHHVFQLDNPNRRSLVRSSPDLTICPSQLVCTPPSRCRRSPTVPGRSFIHPNLTSMPSGVALVSIKPPPPPIINPTILHPPTSHHWVSTGAAVVMVRPAWALRPPTTPLLPPLIIRNVSVLARLTARPTNPTTDRPSVLQV